MQVILLERVEKLGAIGDVVMVKDGFARNFLLPRKKALRANDANRKVFEANRANIEADNAKRRTTAQTDAKDIDGKAIVLIRQASNSGQLYGSIKAETKSGAGSYAAFGGGSGLFTLSGSNRRRLVLLYGSVSARDIVEALEADGAKIGRSQVVLVRPIKALGLHEVRVALHPEVLVAVSVNVARSPEEAELQAQGVDINADLFEREETGFTEDYDPNAEPGEIAAEPAARA